MPGFRPNFPVLEYPTIPGIPTSPVSVPGRSSPPDQLGYQESLGKERRIAWQQPPVPLIFSDPRVDGVVSRATWATPVFDLRSDLLLQTAGDPSYAQAVPRGSVYGSGHTLFVQVQGVATLRSSNILCYCGCIEYADIVNPQLAPNESITQLQDITSDLYDGGTDALLTFEPPQGPPRYWMIGLQFDQVGGVLGDLVGVLTLKAALY